MKTLSGGEIELLLKELRVSYWEKINTVPNLEYLEQAEGFKIGDFFGAKILQETSWLKTTDRYQWSN